MLRKICTLILFAGLLTSCTDPTNAQKALDDLSFKDIRLGGYAWFACSKDDFFHTSFTATNPQKKVVAGTVCSGLFFKNSTVRFN